MEFDLDSKFVRKESGSFYASSKSIDIMESSESEEVIFGFKKSDKISLEEENFLKGNFIFGKDNYGKSNLMVNLMLQRLTSGNEVCFISGKKQNAQNILRKLPEKTVAGVTGVSLIYPFKADTNSKIEIINRGLSRALSESGGYKLKDLDDILSDSKRRDRCISENKSRSNRRHMNRIKDIDKSEFQDFCKIIQNEIEKIENSIKSKRLSIFNLKYASRELEVLIINTINDKIREYWNSEDYNHSYNIFIDNFDYYNKNYDEFSWTLEEDKLCISVSCEYPSELNDFNKDIFSNKNIYSFYIPEKEDISTLDEIFEDDVNIEDLEKYELIGEPHDSSFHSIPPVPNRRKLDDFRK